MSQLGRDIIAALGGPRYVREITIRIPLTEAPTVTFECILKPESEQQGALVTTLRRYRLEEIKPPVKAE